MKTFVYIFLISVTLYDVNTFEYHEEYSSEDADGKYWEEYYKALGDQPYSYYGPILVPLNQPSDYAPCNEIPNEASSEPSGTGSIHQTAPETPEVTTIAAENDVQKDTKKPYYDMKDAPELFRKFIKDFDKHYKDDEEYNKRYQNFARNLKEINKLNKEQDATFDINMFADLGEGESVIG